MRPAKTDYVRILASTVFLCLLLILLSAASAHGPRKDRAVSRQELTSELHAASAKPASLVIARLPVFDSKWNRFPKLQDLTPASPDLLTECYSRISGIRLRLQKNITGFMLQATNRSHRDCLPRLHTENPVIPG